MPDQSFVDDNGEWDSGLVAAVNQAAGAQGNTQRAEIIRADGAEFDKVVAATGRRRCDAFDLNSAVVAILLQRQFADDSRRLYARQRRNFFQHLLVKSADSFRRFVF